MSARARTLPDAAASALDPVRRAIAADAARRVDAHATRARQEAADIEAEARAQAERALAEAEAAGRAAGELVARGRSARARRRAAELVLEHREAARRGLRDAVVAAAAELVHDERYGQILRRLEEHGRSLLGPQARMTEQPEGGVVFETPTRRLDLSLPALAESALSRMSGEVGELWTT